MAEVELTEKLLGRIAGWQALQEARALVEAGQVLSASWTPPVLQGIVRAGTVSFRAGLVLKDAVNVDNLCSCRSSRQWGTICAHSVAVGLRHLRAARESKDQCAPATPPPPGVAGTSPRPAERPCPGGKRLASR